MIEAAYVINLAASTARWRDLQPLLTAMRLPEVTRFEGINGAALSAADLAALEAAGQLVPEASGFNPLTRLGEIGCALSHRGVLADIVAREVPSALILEDDILLAGSSATWRARFARAFADLPGDWELWYLYRCFDIRHRVRRITRRTLIPWTPQGGAAYAVTLAGARKLLAALTPVDNAVDRIYAPLVQRRSVAAYAASPLLILPGTHPSVINRDAPSRKWIEDGINRPPEYWPEMYLAHLGEAVPPTFWRTIKAGAARVRGRFS